MRYFLNQLHVGRDKVDNPKSPRFATAAFIFVEPSILRVIGYENYRYWSSSTLNTDVIPVSAAYSLANRVPLTINRLGAQLPNLSLAYLE